MTSGPPFKLLYSPEALDTLGGLGKKAQHAAKLKKVKKALRTLRDHGPSYPGLHTHKYRTVKGPNECDVWQSYVENKTPGAWRIWWWHGPGDGEITILSIMKHP